MRDRELVSELAACVDALATADDGSRRSRALAALDAHLSSYAAFTWEHLGREEGVILPAAQRHLSDEDWTAIDAAFAANRDPRFGGDADREFRHLFSRIVNLAEPPGSRGGP